MVGVYTYHQGTGELERNGLILGTGFSGRDAGYNNPAMEDEHDVGPIPRGPWTIGPAQTHGELGTVVMALTPEGPAPYGRTGFYMHGWAVDPAKKAESSHGCICMARSIRIGIAAHLDEDNQLEVV